MLLSAMLVAFGSWFTGPSLVVRVDEMRTLAPISEAEVVVMDAGRLGRTDSSGVARLDGLPEGRHLLRIRKLGYSVASVDVMVGQGTDTLEVMLIKRTPTLDTVHVVASRVSSRLREFETRRLQGFGHYITEDELAKQGTVDFQNVVVTHIPGVRYEMDGDGTEYLVSTRGSCGAAGASAFMTTPAISTAPLQGSGSGGAARSTSGSTGAAGGGGSTSAAGGIDAVGANGSMVSSCNGRRCPLVIYIDGIHIPQEGSGLALVRTWDLAGVEYYSGASIPTQYRENGVACGVLLAWSR